ncbi:MAG: cation transporter, partial [Anaerolineales bacterium]
MNNHHDHDKMTEASTNQASGDLAILELEITSYFMGSGCPNIEKHVGELSGVQGFVLNRTTGIIQVSHYPDQVTPETIIEAVKHCGFICQEGGPMHQASRSGSAHAEHLTAAEPDAEAEHVEHPADAAAGEEHAEHEAHAGHEEPTDTAAHEDHAADEEHEAHAGHGAHTATMMRNRFL